jgi:hypothetical protein
VHKNVTNIKNVVKRIRRVQRDGDFAIKAAYKTFFEERGSKFVNHGDIYDVHSGTFLTDPMLYDPSKHIGCYIDSLHHLSSVPSVIGGTCSAHIFHINGSIGRLAWLHADVRQHPGTGKKKMQSKNIYTAMMKDLWKINVICVSFAMCLHARELFMSKRESKGYPHAMNSFKISDTYGMGWSKAVCNHLHLNKPNNPTLE